MNTDYIERVRDDCIESAKMISNEYSRISKMRSWIDAASLLFGVMGASVTVVSLLPSAKIYFAGDTANYITLIACLIVILQFSLDRIFFKDPPGRFRDYAFYLGFYPPKIDAELAKKSPDWKKIEAWVDLAATNLNDASTLWPNLVVRS
jgi:hypothetical protein